MSTEPTGGAVAGLGPTARPGGMASPVGPDQPNPFVRGLGEPVLPGEQDEPDPFAAGLSGTTEPER